MQNLPAPYNTLQRALQRPTPLIGDLRFPDAHHMWCEAELLAVAHAWAAGRPLLVRGEAGCGKSQLARAVAAVLEVPLEMEVIHPRFEAIELLYREDPVKRLAHAQLLSSLAPRDHPNLTAWMEAQMAEFNFVSDGALGRAMALPAKLGENATWPRAVVLVDEIDKADADLPNALLGVLANRSFQKPGFSAPVSCDGNWPLVIITTNEDRELPPAFVRRCAVLNLRPADGDEQKFTQWLVSRAQAHVGLTPFVDGDGRVLRTAAAQVWADRQSAISLSLPTVGLAEYLDLLYSLLRLSGGDTDRAMILLDQISGFALVKNREQDQTRTPRKR